MDYNKKYINIVMVGHVDHGKSTIIGRLLAETNSLPEGKLEQVRKNCEKNSKPFEFAFLLDALKDEQSQGITIDTSRVFFKNNSKNYIIMDAPGHTEFIKNMVTGASRADGAFLVVDANEGVKENTKRHAVLLSLLGVSQIKVLINKMDLIDYSLDKFNHIVSQLKDFLKELDIEACDYIPLSGFLGDNIIDLSPNMPWYNEKTLLESIDTFISKEINTESICRMVLQDVYKFTKNNDSRRIIAGKILSGTLKVGDTITFYPSYKTCKVKTIEEFNSQGKFKASKGESVGITIDNEFYLGRGEIVSSSESLPPKVSDRIKVKLFWLGKKPMDIEKEYVFKIGTAKVTATIEEVQHIINSSNLQKSTGKVIGTNEVALCTLKLSKEIAFDLVHTLSDTSRFVILDNYNIFGGGIILEELPSTDTILKEESTNSKNIYWSKGTVSYYDRCSKINQRGVVIWFTGLPSSGKSTLTIELEKELLYQGKHVYRLDGDNLRHGLSYDLGFSLEDRNENIRRIAEVANLFRDAGIITLVSNISPLEANRELAKKIIGCNNFILVFVKASLESCIERDVKGLYKKALGGEIKEFTGVSSLFEEPISPYMVIDTDKLSVEESVRIILENINFELS